MTTPPKPLGKVFIVGAGVGGVDYLTVKAQTLLLQAETVIYDALADLSLLDLVPTGCDRIDVGKRGGQRSIDQSEINRLLVEQCQQGKSVVRLKSGDPLIFGRVVAEINALKAASCEFEIVPGISSSIAAPLFAGIPLTDADSSPCFTVLTAHDLEILPWSALAEMPTLVILMGTARLGELLQRLRQGKPDRTSIAIIQWCGRPQQKVWTGTLVDIESQLPNHSLSPAVIVVGDVVKSSLLNSQLNDRISTLDRQASLQHKNILVTRAAGQSSQFTELLTAQGARSIEMPTLVILPPSSWEDLDRSIEQLSTYDWLILTSANAVESFFARLDIAQKDSRALHNLKVAVVGKKTATALTQHGIKPDLIPPDFIADRLLDCFPPAKDLHILFPRVQTGGRDVLIDRLGKQGSIVDAVAAYESGCPANINPEALQALQSQRVDAITFASSKTVKHFHQLLEQAAPGVWQSWIDRSIIASIGPQTSATCIELLGRVDCEAKEYTLEGLSDTLTKFFCSRT